MKTQEIEGLFLSRENLTLLDHMLFSLFERKCSVCVLPADGRALGAGVASRASSVLISPGCSEEWSDSARVAMAFVDNSSMVRMVESTVVSLAVVVSGLADVV